ncbi:MAG: hypothetical protein GXP47_02320 [Acidobacteria bacterium]|nr:hypothetical protein [Acidobacteriota bacterium]
MGTRSWIRAAAAILLLLTMAGVAVPCPDAASGGALSLLPSSTLPSPGDVPADCHCVCHASWIPVQHAVCGGEALLSFVETSVPAIPEGSSLPFPGEPPRSA